MASAVHAVHQRLRAPWARHGNSIILFSWIALKVVVSSPRLTQNDSNPLEVAACGVLGTLAEGTCVRPIR
jgi:hypothetical protein